METYKHTTPFMIDAVVVPEVALEAISEMNDYFSDRSITHVELVELFTPLPPTMNITLYERELEARKAVEEKKKQDEELFQRFEGSPLAERLKKELEERAKNLENERLTAEQKKAILFDYPNQH